MFTDMVGYTALGQRNESLSLALVEEQRRLIRPILARHSGREVKTIGDAFLVEFANALDSILCAYDIQRSIREFNLSLAADKRIHLRIGLHVGEVVESQGDISGDAVNVASRIEALAEDGGVCLTRQVFDHVQNKVDLPLTSLGLVSLKNVAAPMEVYKIAMPWRSGSDGQNSRLDKRKIAVLPFKNMSSDPNDEYFAEGLTEELISTLSAVKDLRVVSRTSVMGYRDTQKQLRDIGKELGVGSLIEGSVRKGGTQVRITVQLLDATTDEHIWASKYDRKLDDIFAIQSEVSESVAKALRVELEKSEKERVSKGKTTNMIAFQNYLLGRHLLSQSSEGSLRKSVELFEQAISEDPSFAHAYNGLARAYESLGHQSLMSSPESYRLSRKMVERALQLDPNLGEAHATLGFIALVYEYDLSKAESEFVKALELDPSNSFAHRRYVRCLAAQGRLNDACQHAEMAVELDPLNPSVYSEEGLLYYLNGRDDDAFAVWRKGQDLFPSADFLHFFPINARLARGEYAEAQEELSHLSKTYFAEPFGKYLQGITYGHTGKKDEALKLAFELQAEVQEGRSSSDLIASIYYSLGDAEQFFKWAEEGVKQRHWELFVLRNHSKFFPRLASDPRWERILSTAGLQ
jgi:TolB-like protein